MASAANNSAEFYYIDLQGIGALLWLRRWWITSSVVLFTALFAVLAFTAAPTYRATVLVVPASLEQAGLGSALGDALGSLGGLASLAGINPGAGSAVEEALAILRSRQFTESFIKDHDLMPQLFAGKWNHQAKAWRTDERPPTFAQAHKVFITRICSVVQDKKTGLVTVHVDWRDREQAAVWANELVHRLNAEMRTRAIAKANLSMNYLEKELAGTSAVETREAINRLVEAQIKQRMLANVTREYAFRVVDKAMPPDEDDPIRPRKLMLLAAGAFTGLFIGIIGVLCVQWLSRISRVRNRTGHEE